MTTERTENESAPAYEAFKTYCEMGGERSLAKVGRKVGKAAKLIERWSARHDWKARSALWDNEQNHTEQHAREQAELELARDKAKRRDNVQDSAWELFRKLRNKAEEMLNFPVGKREVVHSRHKEKSKQHPDGLPLEMTVVNPTRWSFGDVARLVDLSDKLGRLATGLATEKHEVTGPDGKPFTIPTEVPPPPVVVLNVTHNASTDEAVAAFGQRPR